MKKETRKKQIEQMIFAGIENLFKSQDNLKFDEFAIITLEGLMLLEREEYLKSHEGEADTGNGVYLRNFKSLRKNSLQIQVPRTRSGQFKPLILDLVNQQKEQINDLALLLYRKGLSISDVSDVMEEYFGESISRSTISNLAESFHEIRMKWQSRELDAYYKDCDALYVSLRRGKSYSKEAVYVMYGVKDDNTRDLLLLEVNPTKGSNMCGEYFSKIRDRGVEQIDLIVADGLVGFADVAKRYYPEADVQRCVVHLQRNMLNKIRPKDKEAFAYDLKQAFNNFDRNSSKVDALHNAANFAK